MRIALLDVALRQQVRLAQVLDIPHTFVAPADSEQAVDAVVALRFGAEQRRLYHPKLLLIPGAGTDAVDFDALPPKCTVCNVFEHEVPVAEYIMAAILEHCVGVSALRLQFDGEQWNTTYASRRPHLEVAGKTLGLIGYGHIGKEVAKRARAFDMLVHAVTRSGSAPGADREWQSREMLSFLAAVDFLVVACPLTEDTRGLLGARQFAAMKPDAVLINIGRAEVSDEQALYDALTSGVLGAAVLDVWYSYPSPLLPDTPPARFPFWKLPNVTCTAHSSAWTEGLFVRRYAVIAENLTRLSRGQPLLNVIHPQTR